MELYSFIGIVEFLNCSKLPAVSSTEKIKKEKTFLRSKSNISLQLILLGKIETEARFLAMRQHCWLMATMLRRNVFSVLFSYAYYLFVQATKLSLNVSSGKFLPIKTRVDLRSVSFQSRPREISKLI